MKHFRPFFIATLFTLLFTSCASVGSRTSFSEYGKNGRVNTTTVMLYSGMWGKAFNVYLSKSIPQDTAKAEPSYRLDLYFEREEPDFQPTAVSIVTDKEILVAPLIAANKTVGPQPEQTDNLLDILSPPKANTSFDIKSDTIKRQDLLRVISEATTIHFVVEGTTRSTYMKNTKNFWATSSVLKKKKAAKVQEIVIDFIKEDNH
jgi:hypothetical protein